MSELMHPIFGDLMLYGVAAMGWLFILALVANAWWEKRQARLLHLQALGRFPPKRSISPVRAFLQKWRGRLLLVVATSVGIVILVRTHKESTDQEQNSDETTPLAAWIDHYEGKMPLSTPPAEATVEEAFTNLWNEPVLHAQTLSLAVDTNLFGADSTQMDDTTPAFKTNRISSHLSILKTAHLPISGHLIQ